MSLPPIKLKGRGSLSLPKALQGSLISSSEFRYYDPQIPIIRLEKRLRPEIYVKKIYSKKSIPSIDNIKMTGSRLSPILASPGLCEAKKKSTYLKKKYVDYIQDQRVSEYANDFTKPIRDYFSVSPPLHKSFIEKTQVKQAVLEKKPEKNTRFENIAYVPEAKIYETNDEKAHHRIRVVHSKRAVPEAKTSMKKQKVEISLSRFINENLQTDWNSFDLEEWELDPDG